MPATQIREITPAQRLANLRYAIRDLASSAEAVVKQGHKVLYLNVGDPNIFDFATPEHVVEAVVKAMLQQFAAMLTSLTGPKVTVINGQGTLAPQTSSWHNELHPAKAGFEKFAVIFQLKLKELFPDRVA